MKQLNPVDQLKADQIKKRVLSDISQDAISSHSDEDGELWVEIEVFLNHVVGCWLQNDRVTARSLEHNLKSLLERRIEPKEETPDK